MRKYIILMIVCFSSFCSFANEWENYIWEYRYPFINIENDSTTWGAPHKLEFSGKTIINNREYSKAYVYNVSESLDTSSMQPAAYLRQDGKKVWMLRNKESNACIETQFTYGMDDREFMIYDYSVGSNDSYNVYSSDDLQWWKEHSANYTYYPFGGIYENYKVKVSAVDTLIISGEMVVRQHISSPIEFEIVENIGCLNSGIFIMPGVYSIYTGWRPAPYLHNVRNKNGEEIYSSQSKVGIARDECSDIKFWTEDGEIICSDSSFRFSVYTFSGVLMANKDLSKGIYIIKGEGNILRKIFVK